MLVGALVDQWIGLGLICALFLFVVRDTLLAVAARHDEAGAEDPAKLKEAREASDSR